MAALPIGGGVCALHGCSAITSPHFTVCACLVSPVFGVFAGLLLMLLLIACRRQDPVWNGLGLLFDSFDNGELWEWTSAVLYSPWSRLECHQR